MPHRLRSDESFELDTFWSRPGANGELPIEGSVVKHHGTLRYSPQRGLELTVFDLFPGLEVFQGPSRVPLLFGETLEHKPCVLFDAVPVSTEGNLFGGHHRHVLRAHRFLLGEHVSMFDRVKSKRFHLRLRGLREWLTTAFRVDPEQVRHGLSREEDLSVQLQGARLLLGFDWRERGGQVIEEHATATFEFEEELELQGFLADWLMPLQDFLVLATREQSILQSLLVERYDERRWESLSPFMRHGASPETWNRYELQLVQTPKVPLARPRENEFDEILLPAAALADDLEGVLWRWYKLRWKLREAGTFFFTSLNHDSPWLTRRLLDRMSFGEAYHRVKHDSTPPLPKDEHRSLRDSMLACLGDHSQRERYKRALDEANRRTNTERITELFDRARGVDFDIALQEETLPGQLVATRNYLAHWGKMGSKVLDGTARFHAVRRLTLVLQVNLLLDLGLDLDTVKACVEESYRTEVWEDGAA
jgi:hypothetical protein